MFAQIFSLPSSQDNVRWPDISCDPIRVLTCELHRELCLINESKVMSSWWSGYQRSPCSGKPPSVWIFQCLEQQLLVIMLENLSLRSVLWNRNSSFGSDIIDWLKQLSGLEKTPSNLVCCVSAELGCMWLEFKCNWQRQTHMWWLLAMNAADMQSLCSFFCYYLYIFMDPLSFITTLSV